MHGGAHDGWAVLEHARELLDNGETFVLATVVWRQGPSSGKEGSRAIVHADGTTYGWIGGNCAEPVLIRESLAAIDDGDSRLLLLGMEGVSDELPKGMISVPISCQSDGALQVHIEPVIPAPTVIVVGRSPMAHTLVDLVEGIGWRGIVSDRGLPEAVPGGAAIVVATQGDGDEELLLAAMDLEPSYVGLVASARRGDVVLSYLRDQGVSQEQAAAIRVPAGLDLGHTSHREMAVSILAELVAVRASGGLTPAGSVAAAAAMPATAIDPICGMEVRADESSRPYEYEGETYYFCCPACRNTFVSDPVAHSRSAHADQD